MLEADGKVDLEHTAPVNPSVEEEDEPVLRIGGALRFNYQFRDWSQFHKDQGGAFTFDTWRINVDAQAKGILMSMEYRFYSGFSMFHHGWVGYNITPQTQVQLGINQVPFGLLPYASHSWWFQTGYYVGLEDDYDMGIKLLHKTEKWDLAIAFYKEAEPVLTGSSLASARYSYDVVPTLPANIPQIITRGTPGTAEDSVITSLPVSGQNREVNQLNIRGAYRVTPDIELGISLQAGGIYNQEAADFGVDEMGSHYAAAVHLNATFNRFNLLAEYAHYEYNLPDMPNQTEDAVVMGAYDLPYFVASEASLYLVGLSYRLNVEWGPVSSLTFYDNYSYMDKANGDFVDTQQHTLGCLVSAGQLFTYIDIASGRNHPWLGPFEENWTQSLAAGSLGSDGSLNTDPEWHTRVNINIGYYF